VFQFRSIRSSGPAQRPDAKVIGGKSRTSPAFVSPAALDTLTRRHLRETFRAIRHVQIRADQDWIRRLTHDR
jgi:hypothetical protein